MAERNIYTVTEINRYIKSIIVNDSNLRFIYVKGEISNFKNGAGGHLYFSLKDNECLINVVMFSTYVKKLTFTPKNGDEITVLASVDVYPGRGTYQLVAYDLEQKGQGSILVELEKLKKQLMSEGLFDESRKRKINIYPNKIGVITAQNGAAIKDIITNIKRRYPIAEIYFFPSQVQGDSAPTDLLRAFKESQKYDLDTLIIGRGGGASEDLSAFNDETLVRAIAESKMPVIAAVGHEIDFTLVDYVADKRASTPTGAAEIATVDQREIQQHFQYALDDMQEAIETKLYDLKKQFDTLKNALANGLVNKTLLMRKDTDSYKDKISKAMKDKLVSLSNSIEMYKQRLIALNPTAVLSRGYSISLDENGKAVKSIKDIKVGSNIVTILNNGKIISSVKEVKEK